MLDVVQVFSVIFRAIRSGEEALPITRVSLPSPDIFRAICFVQRAVALAQVAHKTADVARPVGVAERPVSMLEPVLPLPVILASFAHEEGPGSVHFIVAPLAHVPVAVGEDHGALALA